eukprot:scaffold92771_cov36-Phaeocystis_antarctica.AAC.1
MLREVTAQGLVPRGACHVSAAAVDGGTCPRRGSDVPVWRTALTRAPAAFVARVAYAAERRRVNTGLGRATQAMAAHL